MGLPLGVLFMRVDTCHASFPLIRGNPVRCPLATGSSSICGNGLTCLYSLPLGFACAGGGPARRPEDFIEWYSGIAKSVGEFADIRITEDEQRVVGRAKDAGALARRRLQDSG